MKHDQILNHVFNVLFECNVHSFPFECGNLFKHYGYKVFTYEELRRKNEELYDMCKKYSDDAFRDGNSKIIAYNAETNLSRIRFSLMHELGHVVMNHRGSCIRNEQDANFFASNILAPRMAIHYADCKNHIDVAKRFDISYEAAEYAFDDYRRWHRTAVYRMSMLDKEMYQHFYNQGLHKFVWNVGECIYCHRPIYNDSQRHVCSLCSTRHYIAGLGYFEVPDNLQWYNRL